VRRADRAYDDQRWTDAAAAYRELLRRFPGHRLVAAWRARLASCNHALAQ
jgi:hypothetical protein